MAQRSTDNATPPAPAAPPAAPPIQPPSSAAPSSSSGSFSSSLPPTLAALYSPTSAASIFRPQSFSLVMTVFSGASTALVAAMGQPFWPSAMAVAGFAWSYECFRQGNPLLAKQAAKEEEEEASAAAITGASPPPARQLTAEEVAAGKKYRKEKRAEGYMAGIGTSALLGSGQLSLYRLSKAAAAAQAGKQAAAAAVGSAAAKVTAAAAAAAGTAAAITSAHHAKQAPGVGGAVAGGAQGGVGGGGVGGVGLAPPGSTRNPLAINMLLLSAASAFYYSGLMVADTGDEE